MILQPTTLTALPLGTIQPRGWLLRQLSLQADGLTGHLDEFWPSVKDSRWIGGESEGWERGPYWLDGLIPLAFLLDDERLKAKAQTWVDYILREQHEDGWLGAKDDEHEGEGIARLDPWPLFVLFKAFLQWHEATGDERITPALMKCAGRVHHLLQEEPLRSWAKLRWADFVWSLHRLHELSGEAWLLELAATCQQQGFDWNAHFADLPLKVKAGREHLGEEVALPLHGVNNAMGLKTGAVWWRQSARGEDLALARLALDELDHYHGNASGMFNADEHLAGRSPSQGFETCAVVEEMFSLEVAGAASGDALLFDRLEQVAFNALAASCAADMWSHQYHQQTNQVVCSVALRDWTDSGPRTNLFGQDVNFGCCQANLHQGWPKFAASLWMKASDGALVATAFAPSEVRFDVADVPVTVTEETDYPFKGEVRFSIQVPFPVFFALRMRAPAWASGATWSVNDEPEQEHKANGFFSINRLWSNGDTLSLALPLSLRAKVCPKGNVSFHRGPLLLALPVQEEWHRAGSPYAEEEPRAQEWEVLPRSSWNYALAVRPEEAEQLEVEERDVPPLPWSAQAPPVQVGVPARRVPSWELEHNSAALPPVLLASSLCEPLEWVQLVPYGSARLRVAEFPSLDSGRGEAAIP